MPPDDERPAGDPDPNLPPDPDAGQETGTPAPRDEPGKGEGEEKDERGVPLKNVLAEAERKRKRAEDDLAEANRRAQTLEEQNRQLAAAIPPAPQPQGSGKTEDEELAELMYSNPAEYHRRITQKATDGARQATRWEIGQQAKLKDTLDKFPELKDVGSDFAREVAVEYASRKRYYGLREDQQDAVLLADAAAAVEVERVRKAKKKESGAEPLAPTAEGGRGGGRSGGGAGPKKGEMTEDRRRIARELGMSEAEAKDAYTHYLPEETNA